MSTGTLFIVATPIGNIDDISLRARNVLAEVAIIAAEDTRHTAKLLRRLGIDSRLLSCHEHNEEQRIPMIVEYLSAGKDVAMVSDAGTPLLSDPGFRLVRAVAEQKFTISPIPGCSAAIAALSIAGLPTDSFSFEGFLPASAGKRRAQLQQLAQQTGTLLLYESVHRIKATLADFASILGSNRHMVAARELTKLHETIYRGTVAEVANQIEADPGGEKGEYTLVIAGAPEIDADAQELDRVLKVLLTYLGVRQSAEAASRLLDSSKNEAYERALQLRESSDGDY